MWLWWCAQANAIVQDIRRIVRNDTRVINKLHRRVFLDKITREDAKIYMSFYLEAANRWGAWDSTKHGIQSDLTNASAQR